MDEVRWFAPNSYCALPVPALREAGLRIALDGDAPARLAFAADNQCVVGAWEYAARHRCPLAVYLWDLPPWRLGGGAPDWVFPLGGRIRRIPRLIGGYPERAGYYSRIHWAARRAAAVWCPSTQTASDVRARFGLEACRVPFCYDSDRFVPAAAPWNGRAREVPVVLAVSRLVPHKDHASLVMAAALVAAKPLVRIIGEGPEAPRLVALARELGVGLELTGRVDADQVVAAYRQAHVVVAPSRFEGLGLSAIEAVACGTPAVASQIPSHREFLNGLVTFFPPGDVEALARAITDIVSRPRPAPRAAGSPFPELTIEACAGRLHPRLEQVLGRSP